MKTEETVTTNLRLPRDDWRQIKALAGELGMSVNGYINFLIKGVAIKRELAEEREKDFADLPIWRLGKIVSGKGRGLGKDDRVIYE